MRPALRVDDLVTAIESGEPPAVDGSRARETLRIILAIKESVRKGLAVKLS